MFREVHIQRVNDDELTPLMANAATPRRYKQVFGDDLLTLFANAEKDTEDGGKVYKIDFIAELAYIMSMQAQAADGKARLDKLNSNGFLDWLEQFEGMAFENAATEILNVYLGNTATASTAKKNNEEQNES